MEDLQLIKTLGTSIAQTPSSFVTLAIPSTKYCF